jgi:hypothetical protein
MGISPRPESAEGLRDASAAICLLGILGGDAMEPWLVAGLVAGLGRRAGSN